MAELPRGAAAILGSRAVKVGDKVIATAGPYEGRQGTIEDHRSDGQLVVRFPATSYDGERSGRFDPRWLRKLS